MVYDRPEAIGLLPSGVSDGLRPFAQRRPRTEVIGHQAGIVGCRWSATVRAASPQENRRSSGFCRQGLPMVYDRSRSVSTREPEVIGLPGEILSGPIGFIGHVRSRLIKPLRRDRGDAGLADRPAIVPCLPVGFPYQPAFVLPQFVAVQLRQQFDGVDCFGHTRSAFHD
jgi:hypothetical protein